MHQRKHRNNSMRYALEETLVNNTGDDLDRLRLFVVPTIEKVGAYLQPLAKKNQSMFSVWTPQDKGVFYGFMPEDRVHLPVDLQRDVNALFNRCETMDLRALLVRLNDQLNYVAAKDEGIPFTYDLYNASPEVTNGFRKEGRELCRTTFHFINGFSLSLTLDL